MLDKLKCTILEIDSLQNKFYKKLLEKEITSNINLSKIEVRHIMDSRNIQSKKFFEYLPQYLREVNEFSLMEFHIFDIKDEQVTKRTRIKSRKSIEQKLEQYQNKKDSGKFPLQKCLNDLCGFRMVIDCEVNDLQGFKEMCEKLKKDNIIYRHYFREDDTYRGYHIYFKNKSNLFFPWELQVWYNEDEKDNYSSHEKHKQGYIRK